MNPEWQQPTDTAVTSQLVLFRAVALLYEIGYESIRALPYMSPTGLYWRMEIRAIEDAGPQTDDVHNWPFGADSGHAVYYSSAGCEQFDTELHEAIREGSATPGEVAGAIHRTLPAARLHPGADPGYVKWFAELTAASLALETVPFAFDDSWETKPGWQFTRRPRLRFDEPPAVSERLMEEITTDEAPAPVTRDEIYVLDLCDQLLGPGERQKRFDWLLGDASLKTGKRLRLPLDGYWDEFSVAVEFQERQHFEPVPFWDSKPTASGMTRGEQRKLYDQRKVEKTAENGVRLLVIPYTAFHTAKGKIIKDPQNDLEIVRRLLRGILGDALPATGPTHGDERRTLD